MVLVCEVGDADLACPSGMDVLEAAQLIVNGPEFFKVQDLRKCSEICADGILCVPSENSVGTRGGLYGMLRHGVLRHTHFYHVDGMEKN